MNEFKADAHDLKVQLRERDAQAEVWLPMALKPLGAELVLLVL